MLSVCGEVGPGMGSRVELFAAIRFDWQRNGMSIRALADKYEVHRRTVRQAIESGAAAAALAGAGDAGAEPGTELGR